MERTLKVESEKFLIEYGAEVLQIDGKYPEMDGSGERMRQFSKLRDGGIKRIKALVAEFGKT